jgi:ribulose-5-phosphate 4-epimerase/fuculose-1-phosphate aldolase
VISSGSSVTFEPPTYASVDEERAARKGHLAVAYRLFAQMGYDHWVAGHITVRDPEFPDRFWVNPFGKSWRHLRASDLLLVDLDGTVLEGDGVLNAAAFAIHSEVHRARPDVVAAAHAHTRFGRAWSATGRVLEPLSQDACAFYGDHAVFDDYSGVVYDPEEGSALARALGDRKALLLEHHGLLTVGETVADAFVNMYYLEASCQIQVRAQSGGGELISVPKEVMDKGYANAVANQRKNGGQGRLVWPGLLRRLDRTDSSFRN